MQSFPELPERYRVILCDLWGVVHNGYRLFPGVLERLRSWKNDGRIVIFVTNAPRSSHIVEQGLRRLGLPPSAYDAVVTAGDAGITELRGRAVGFLGTEEDKADLMERGLALVDAGFSELACAGLTEQRPAVEDYLPDLRTWAGEGVILHCLNPDRVVIHGHERLICAGALADAYEALGGTVHWYGKPHPDIYEEAFRLAGNPELGGVLAIGDGLHTDLLGAARQGIAAIYVTSGVHSEEPFPADFGDRFGTGAWAPIATVRSIGA